MSIFKISITIAAVLLILTLLLAYVCFYIIFYVPKKKEVSKDDSLPQGKSYEPYHDIMKTWMKNFRTFPHEVFSIRSFDGLTLYANYYECETGAPVELMFHGWRGTAQRDLSVGIQRCFSMGRNALIVDQRASGRSQGNVITFGIKEYRDCLSWIDFAINHFGSDVKLILTGISMGASTVLMAGGTKLPKNIAYILADCGYSSARDIIKKCAGQLHLPANLLYPFIKLGAKLYGHFDLEEFSPEEAMKTCQVPVVFIHGEADDFVPQEMSKINYAACASTKKLLTIPNAVHGISYLVDKDAYIDALLEISAAAGLDTKLVPIEE